MKKILQFMPSKNILNSILSLGYWTMVLFVGWFLISGIDELKNLALFFLVLYAGYKIAEKQSWWSEK